MSIPNTTPTPNIIFNGLMRKMNDTEFRIVMLVVRATLGWEADKETGMRKVEDWISSRQLKEKTGRHSGALSSAIDKCISEGWIEARDKNGELLDTKGKRKGKNIYFRLGKSILFVTSLESEEVIVKDEKDQVTSAKSEEVNDPTSAKTANAKTANAKSEDYKRNTIQNKNITKREATEQSSDHQKLIADIVYAFKDVNPSYKRLFGIPPQRKAAERLLEEHGEEKLRKIIAFLPKSNGVKFAPTITTPAQLEAKLGELIAFIQKERSSHQNKIGIAL